MDRRSWFGECAASQKRVGGCRRRSSSRPRTELLLRNYGVAADDVIEVCRFRKTQMLKSEKLP
jgi:hypothetical protein